MTGRVRSVFSVCVFFSSLIGREVHPVTDDRTRPAVQGAYWTVTGRWHCRVRSCFFSASGRCFVERCSGDQRVWSFMGPTRSVCAMSASDRCFAVSHCAAGVSGRLDQRVRSVFHMLAVGRPARPVSWTSASGQHDFDCLSF
jgi:hypothetical protein